MANTDATITLAGQFAVLDPKQLRLVEIAGKAAAAANAKQTVAQWNALLATATGLFPPQIHRNMQAQRAALYWQMAVLTNGTGITAPGRSNSQILDLTSYLQGLDDWSLDALNLYAEGRFATFTSVFT